VILQLVILTSRGVKVHQRLGSLRRRDALRESLVRASFDLPSSTRLLHSTPTPQNHFKDFHFQNARRDSDTSSSLRLSNLRVVHPYVTPSRRTVKTAIEIVRIIVAVDYLSYVTRRGCARVFANLNLTSPSHTTVSGRVWPCRRLSLSYETFYCGSKNSTCDFFTIKAGTL
jgi:hypothetical protein